MRGSLLAAVAAALTLLPGCGSGGGPPRISGELVGVMLDGPALSPDVELGRQLDSAVAGGVESLRVAVDWSQLQPYRTESDVPAVQRSQFTMLGGVPTRLGELDRVLAAAAERGLTVLPVIEYTPVWDASRPVGSGSPPARMAPYAAFLTGLVRRYGPGGTFWTTHPRTPRVPIRMWQIWNEPHFSSYWSAQPFAPSFVRLLSVSRSALKAADPGAELVLAGLAGSSWQYLADIYRVAGARSLFDVVAIHPYTAQPAGVITILQRVRTVMTAFGDGAKPILVTEVTWPSSEGKAPPQFGVSTTETEQARRLGQLLPLLERDRSRLGLMGFYWYTWLGDESPSRPADAFRFAGLLKYVRGVVTAKPALAVFTAGALRIEGCRRKVSAGSCAG